MKKKMIDTLILNIPLERVAFIKQPDYVEWSLKDRSVYFRKYIKRQTKQQKNDGIYRPRVMIFTQGKDRKFLKIEFSAPKLIFNNNVDELSEKDFDNVITTLQKRLKDFDINIFDKHLRQAQVQCFHPSKNFILKNGYTSVGVISELNKIDLTKKMDLTQQKFRNGGQSLQCYAKSNSCVFYDKIADLKKTKSRAIDKDQPDNQLSLFDPLDKKKHFEILRLEVRLSEKSKMNSTLQKLGYAKNPSFENVFNKNLCQKIVNMYWQKIIIDKNLFIFSMINSPTSILNKLARKNPDMKTKKLIYLVGLKLLCNDNLGIKNLENIVIKNSSSANWNKIKREDFKVLNKAENIAECHSWVNQISQDIEKFKPLKVYDLII